MACFALKTQVLLYPSIFFILLFSALNHHYRWPSLANKVHTNPEIFSPGPVHNISNINGTTNITTTSVKSEKKSKLMILEEGLAGARNRIRIAAKSRWKSIPTLARPAGSYVPEGDIYLNPNAFHQSHIEMKKRFKVWSYREGEAPLFHNGPMKDIYSIEGHIIDEMESGKSRFIARNPDEALMFFVPISVVNIVQYVYRPYIDYSRARLQNIVKEYIQVVSNRYSYWNTSSGADHFMVSCHDWAPDVSAADPVLYKHFTRVLCNANSSEGFIPSRDVSLPEIFGPSRNLGTPRTGNAPTNRSVLAFFAGGRHGHVRERLFDAWKEKDNDVLVYEYLPKSLNYNDLMDRSKYCLCPSGHEVASPRVVESIYAGCVPVIISDSYVLPFSDVLNWTRFSVQIPVSKMADIKSVLEGIPVERYLELQRNVYRVQRHFVVNRPSKPFDVIDMVMHSIWLRRINVKLPL